MRKSSPFAVLIFLVILALGGGLACALYGTELNTGNTVTWIVTFVIALVVSLAIQIADQWERVVILRLGKFRALKGPGLFFIIPIIDVAAYWIDTRVITAAFKAEKTLTKDTVPVDVDAVLFWKVLDPKKAALDVADYRSAISWASQTALRDVIGKTMLSDMLEGRGKISDELQKIIDERTEPWGIKVISVEVKDVLIPAGLENAMSMQAQAERERQARVILGDAERQRADSRRQAFRHQSRRGAEHTADAHAADEPVDEKFVTCASQPGQPGKNCVGQQGGDHGFHAAIPVAQHAKENPAGRPAEHQDEGGLRAPGFYERIGGAAAEQLTHGGFTREHKDPLAHHIEQPAAGGNDQHEPVIGRDAIPTAFLPAGGNFRFSEHDGAFLGPVMGCLTIKSRPNQFRDWQKRAAGPGVYNPP